jgi:hypothetical protein
MNPGENSADRLINEETTKDCCCSVKYVQGSIIWFACVLLLIPSYLDTGIWSIAALIPIVGILGVYFLLEGKRTSVIITPAGLEMTKRNRFTFEKELIQFENIRKINVDITQEEKEEVINTINLVTDNDTIHVPDIDDKDKLLKHLIEIHKNLTIEKTYKLSEKQNKQVKSLMIFSVFIAILGVIYNLVLAPESADTAAFLSILKGGFIGYIIGIILWFCLFNLKGHYDKG